MKKISKLSILKNPELNLNIHSKISVMLLAYGGSHQKIISSIAGILESAHINFIIVAPPGSQAFLRSRHKNVVTFSEICCFPEIPEEYRT
ncbi:hypothetical protein KAJ27_18180, partial [bacterium]|nr:hypothetical protein [bacterium]